MRDYYGDAHAGEDNVEAEYHTPPRPATGRIGDVITLTGTNIGVRLRVKLLGLTPAVRIDGDRYAAARLQIVNTGIAVFESEMRNARLIDASGNAHPAAAGVSAGCSNAFDGLIRLDVGLRARGCVLFPMRPGDHPQELQLALEQVPAEAGGRWAL